MRSAQVAPRPSTTRRSNYSDLVTMPKTISSRKCRRRSVVLLPRLATYWFPTPRNTATPWFWIEANSNPSSCTLFLPPTLPRTLRKRTTRNRVCRRLRTSPRPAPAATLPPDTDPLIGLEAAAIAGKSLDQAVRDPCLRGASLSRSSCSLVPCSLFLCSLCHSFDAPNPPSYNPYSSCCVSVRVFSLLRPGWRTPLR